MEVADAAGGGVAVVGAVVYALGVAVDGDEDVAVDASPLAVELCASAGGAVADVVAVEAAATEQHSETPQPVRLG